MPTVAVDWPSWIQAGSAIAQVVLAFGVVYVAWLAWRTQHRSLDLESRPALLVMVELVQAEQDETQSQWDNRASEEKFQGLQVTNKGKGAATLEKLYYGDDPQSFFSLEDAYLPLDATVFFPCKGMIAKVETSKSKECFILYGDPLGKKQRQRFRINLKSWTAVPLRCENF